MHARSARTPPPAEPAPAIATVMLRATIEALEADPDLAARLRTALGLLDGEVNGAPPPFMSVGEYAAYARVSEKTIRAYVRDGMVEGEQFHREGRTGRRIVIHVRQADLWRTARKPTQNPERTLEDLATNDILRRRAQVALKKARGSR